MPTVEAAPAALWPLIFEHVLACQCPLQWIFLRTALGPTVEKLLQIGGLAPWAEHIFNAMHRNSVMIR